MDSEMFINGGDHSDAFDTFLKALLVMFVILSIFLVCFQTYVLARVLLPQSEGYTNGYIGASTNIIRDDTGWSNVDTLAEQAAKMKNAVTDMGAETYTHRYTERMTPEEIEEQKRRAQ